MPTCPTCGQDYKGDGWRKYLGGSGKKLSFYSNLSKDGGTFVGLTALRVPPDISEDNLEAIMLLIDIEHGRDEFFRWSIPRENMKASILGRSSAE